jgi:hypothetical protein
MTDIIDLTGKIERRKLTLEDFADTDQPKRRHDKGTTEGARLLDDIYDFIGRFVVYPSKAAQAAHALWIAHTHLMECWDSTPRIAFLSPEPGSGKSRALEVSELLVPNAILTANATPAYVFRKVGESGDALPTILYDEIDTVFGPHANEKSEEIRGLINAGHRRDAKAGRCVIKGNRIETEEIPAYCAIAMAGLNDLPDTIRTRSIVIRMRKRAANETVEPFRRRVHEKGGLALQGRIAVWAESVASDLNNAWPEMPPEIRDRDADVWEPLFAIANAAGGHWPETVRVTSVTLVTSARVMTPTLGVQLLIDMKRVFGEDEKLTTATILPRLANIPESAWANIKGKPLDDRGLATRLKKYEIVPKVIKIDGVTARGYKKEDFHDAWQRYVPAIPSSEDA